MKQLGSTVSKQNAKYFTIAAIVLFFSITALFVGCNSSVEEISKKPNYEIEESLLNLNFKEPVHRDFADIKREGVIRMITRFNSSSYFLHRGEEKGFEFELAQAFANEHGLSLQVVVSPENEHPIDMLNSGKGDFVAANFSITPERLDYISFSKPYNIVNQILVFREGKNTPRSLDELNNIRISVRNGSSYYKTLRRLQDEHGYTFEIELLPEIWDTEAILFALIDG